MKLHQVIVMCLFAALSCALAIVGLAHGADDCETATHCALLRIPRHETDLDESTESRSARMLDIANAIDGAAPDVRKRSMLVAVVRYEVQGARYVYENRCFDGPRGKLECDRGKSKSVFQLKANRNYPVIPDDSASHAAIALRVLRGGLGACKSLEGAFWRYGVGNGCDSAKWTRERADYTIMVERGMWGHK